MAYVPSSRAGNHLQSIQAGHTVAEAEAIQSLHMSKKDAPHLQLRDNRLREGHASQAG